KLEVSEIAKALKIIGLKFDLVITSPLKRAYDTATIVSEVLKLGNKAQVWKELAPEGKKTELYRKISELKEEYVVLMVGHQPIKRVASAVGEGSTVISFIHKIIQE
ncbi:MAG TPA: histidine phosphatase family protein, partial [Nitrososphaeraceae archaeon]|nr:histidine phosphatase family protein [Nitrososphaeraceae archaeon]